LLDVRSPAEWDAGHVPGARHLFLGELHEKLRDLNPDRPVVVYCASGYRSSLAASLLQASGLRNVRNVQGGYAAWTAAEFPVVIPVPTDRKACGTRP
jgi:hydroxyacylglutathione hydrolase